jgi:hypothetical protein
MKTLEEQKQALEIEKLRLEIAKLEAEDKHNTYEVWSVVIYLLAWIAVAAFFLYLVNRATQPIP